MKQMKQTIRIISVICSKKKDICCTFAKVFYQNFIFYKVFKMLLPLLVREDEERFFLCFYCLFFILANIGTQKLGVSLNLLKVYHLHKSSG